MAVDKLVDSAQLDADLTSVANAIRTKGGTSASLAFPADFLTAIAAIPTGGGGSGVSGTFTPSSNLRSVTLSDCIGKSNLLIYPMFDITSSELSVRMHWGCLISGGRCILVASTNSGKSSMVFYSLLKNETGETGTKDTWNSTTGALSIGGGSDSNYGGYFLSGKQYGYVAW